MHFSRGGRRNIKTARPLGTNRMAMRRTSSLSCAFVCTSVRIYAVFPTMQSHYFTLNKPEFVILLGSCTTIIKYLIEKVNFSRRSQWLLMM
uniref:Ovule protein n=1 Tax=Ascaris lumbricoides TaxID=6252 RepID=A0A0M3IB80_ASCLU